MCVTHVAIPGPLFGEPFNADAVTCFADHRHADDVVFVYSVAESVQSRKRTGCASVDDNRFAIAVLVGVHDKFRSAPRALVNIKLDEIALRADITAYFGWLNKRCIA